MLIHNLPVSIHALLQNHPKPNKFPAKLESPKGSSSGNNKNKTGGASKVAAAAKSNAAISSGKRTFWTLEQEVM